MKTSIKTSLTLGLLIAGFAQSSAQCLSCTTASPINADLELCMPFNGNANDEGPNGLNGTPSNATLTTDRFGNANSAYAFSGSSSYVAFPATSLTFNTYTYSVWVKVTTAPSVGAAYSAISIGNTSALGDQDILWGNAYNSNEYGPIAVSYPDPAAAPPDKAVSNVYTGGVWQHIVSVRDEASNKLKIYVDGTKITETTLTSSSAGYDTPTLGYIGARVASGTYQNFIGIIDDVRIYSRALSDADIVRLYDYCCLTCTSTSPLNNNLELCMPFNGNAYDESSNGLNGTVVGASLTSDRYGNANSAYSFNGSTDYISFPASSLTFNTYTYSVWTKVNSAPSSGNAYSVLSIGNTSSLGDQDILWGDAYNGSQNGPIAVSYTNPASAPPDQVTSNLNPTGVWQHIVTVRDASTSKLKIYIDGIKISDVALSSSNAGYSTPVTGIIGARVASGNYQNFNGIIDDVRIYSRALTDSEVVVLHDPCGDSSVFFKGRQTTGFPTKSMNLKEASLFPNPANSALPLTIQHAANTVEITIYNMLGECVFTLNNASKDDLLSVDISNLKPNLYIINFRQEGGTVMQKKLVIQ